LKLPIIVAKGKKKSSNTRTKGEGERQKGRGKKGLRTQLGERNLGLLLLSGEGRGGGDPLRKRGRLHGGKSLRSKRLNLSQLGGERNPPTKRKRIPKRDGSKEEKDKLHEADSEIVPEKGERKSFPASGKHASRKKKKRVTIWSGFEWPGE